MRVIGITGSIACGKSTVSSELIRLGYPVIDGDVLARELTGINGQAVQQIRSAFGDDYILPDGSMDRRKMGRLVFSDSVARQKLDRTLAPFLKSLTQERIEQTLLSGASLCFLDMPLLYEKGYDQYCDSVWCVWLPEDIQLQRLMARDSLDRADALNRMRSVMSSDEKADLSPVVIDNSGSIGDTLDQVHDQLEMELKRSLNVPKRRRVPEAAMRQPVTPVVSAYAPDPRPVLPSYDRPDAARRKPSERLTSWLMPKWIRAALIVLSAILAVSFTAQMLMNAYLTRRAADHIAEQKNIDEQYPLMYEDLIRSIASEYNLSPALISAVIRNESSFRSSVESSVGARGLMQLMPDTAQWIAGKLKTDDYSFERLYDPETNIRFGCWYLNYLSSLFNSNPLCVICAYHAGQNEIAGWLSNALYSSDGITLNESALPDGPTKQYAGRVTRDYGIYLAKFFTENPFDITSDNTAVSD